MPLRPGAPSPGRSRLTPEHFRLVVFLFLLLLGLNYIRRGIFG